MSRATFNVLWRSALQKSLKIIPDVYFSNLQRCIYFCLDFLISHEEKCV